MAARLYVYMSGFVFRYQVVSQGKLRVSGAAVAKRVNINDLENGQNVDMHSLVIPRAVCVLAGGIYAGEKDADGRTIIKVAAKIDDDSWKIIQSPFMQKNASTTEFRQEIVVGNGRLSYSQTTMVDIYGKVFEHTDHNELVIS